MVEINIDPIEVSPIANSPMGARRPSSPKPAEENGEFSRILSRRIQQEPTPILTPNDLQEKTSFPSILPQLTPLPAAQPQPSETVVPNPQPIPDAAPKTVENPSNNPPLTLQELMNRNRTIIEPSEPAKAPETEAPSQTPKTETQDHLHPIVLSYTVKKGDTLSDIVADKMKEQGVAFDAPTLYRRVRAVAAANGIANLNLIFPGQTVDLSPMLEERTPGADSKVDLLALQDMQPPAHGQITSRFGMRDHPILDGERFHSGVDIAMPIGSPVEPVKTGEVIFSGEKNGYGLMVEIDHGGGVTTRYGHLSELFVKIGDAVAPGNPLGLSGETGLATGPHLHLEIREAGKPIDPLTILSQETIESGASESGKIIARGVKPNPDV